MTTDEIFNKIDEVYCDHDGGAIYLSDEHTKYLKKIIQDTINFVPTNTDSCICKKPIIYNSEEWVERCEICDNKTKQN